MQILSNIPKYSGERMVTPSYKINAKMLYCIISGSQHGTIQAHVSNKKMKSLSRALREKCQYAEFFFYFIFPRIWTEYGKIWTRKTLYLDSFHAVDGIGY